MAVAVTNSRIYSRLKERDRLAALGAMAAGLAHEVKNPLGSIQGAAQLLEEVTSGDATQTEFLGIILEETTRLNNIVGSFLDYARPNEGNPVPVDVNGAIRRTVQILGNDLGPELEFSLDLADDLPPANIDPEQLRQVLLNLSQNAAQAMNGAGRITIATARRGLRSTEAIDGDDAPKGAQDASVRKAGEGAQFDAYAARGRTAMSEGIELIVRDTGPGIAPKVLPNLFVPFFTTKQKGTGLGLAISQRIVQGAGGSIAVASQEGSGTTFTIRLPVA
jgi:signal transduction histidine kinase